MPAVITIAFDDLINIYKMGTKFGVPLHAPNFDRLAEMGVSFDAAYTPVAVCNPARTAAMSGQSQFRTGLHNTNDLNWTDVMTPEETIVGMFNAAGWTTYGTGKVYHDSASPAAARLFDDLYDGHFQSHPRTTPTLDRNPIAEPLDPGETMRDDPNVAWAIDRLAQYDGSDNMLLTLGIIKPHVPFIAPQEYFDLYPRDSLSIPYKEGDLSGVSDFYKQFRLLDNYQNYLENNDLALDFIQGYLAALSYADAKLGEVLDAIADNPALADASLVIWSDHGYELGDKQTWHKFTLWEEAANIPFIVVDPSLTPGTVNDTPVSLLDLAPTLLDLAGIPVPPDATFDGDSVLPFIETPETDRVAVTSMLGSLSMRAGDFRLIFYNDTSVELYNVVRDPAQLTNLARDARNGQLVADLTDRLVAEVAAQGGTFDPDALTLIGTMGGDSMFVAGAQTAVGGGGDDIYFVTDQGTVSEIAGGGHDRVIFAATEFHVPLNVEFAKNSTYINADGVLVYGNEQDNHIRIQSTPGEVFGFEGNDTIEGSGTRDTLDGGAGDDHLMGGSGDDQLTGRDGDDVIDGGAGWDTAHANFARDSVWLRIHADGDVTLADRRPNGQGTDSLQNVEALRLDQVADFDILTSGGIAALAPDALAELVELYLAYFDRAPDAVGMHFWGAEYARGLPLEMIAELFFDQPETRALYPDPANLDVFVTAVYQNVLGRDPDAEGFVFWTGVLSRGEVTQGQFVMKLLQGARADTGSVSDAAYLDDKIKIGVYHALIKGLSDPGSGRSAMELFDGTESGLRAARDAIDQSYDAAVGARDGGVIIELVGIVENPFETS